MFFQHGLSSSQDDYIITVVQIFAITGVHLRFTRQIHSDTMGILKSKPEVPADIVPDTDQKLPESTVDKLTDNIRDELPGRRMSRSDSHFGK